MLGGTVGVRAEHGNDCASPVSTPILKRRRQELSDSSMLLDTLSPRRVATPCMNRTALAPLVLTSDQCSLAKPKAQVGSSCSKVMNTWSGSTQSQGTSVTCNSVPRLRKLELINFGAFRRHVVSFHGHGLECVVGPNASGKSSLAKAVLFLMCQRDDVRANTANRLLHYTDTDRVSTGQVTAHFESTCVTRASPDTTTSVNLVLRREICLSDMSRYWIGTGVENLREVDDTEYQNFISKDLFWTCTEWLLPQFGLQEGHSALELLQALPRLLSQHTISGPRGSLLKRRGTIGGVLQSCATPSVQGEARLSRRVDEIYRELSREPLDDTMQHWGEGGEAALRRNSDGELTVIVAQQRGLIACGRGSAFDKLCDGEHDAVSLALFLAMAELRQSNTRLPFVLLDAPDSRFDRRHSFALQRFLTGPECPCQCILLSLNNYHAFNAAESLSS